MKMDIIPTRTVVAMLMVLTVCLTSCSVDVDTQLMQAARDREIKRVRGLLDLGADANTTNLNGFTILLYASAQGDVEIVQALIGAGAEIDRSNIKGRETWTPLIYAAKGGHKVTVKTLLEAGADVSVERQGMTALKMATSQGDTDIVRLLREAGATQ